MKGATSFRVNREIQPSSNFNGKKGMGVVSLRKEEIEKVSRYIDRQEDHHRRGKISTLLEMVEADEDDWLKP